MKRNDPGRMYPASDAVAPAVESQEVPAVAKAMPWALSLMLHAGIILVLALATIIIQPPPPVMGQIDPYVAGPVSIDPPITGQIALLPPPKGREDGNARQDGGEKAVKTDRKLMLTVEGSNGPKVGGTVSGLFDSHNSRSGIKWGTPNGKGVGFFDSRPTTPLRHAVFVIDRSGSMLDGFDRLRQELLHSIGRMNEGQDFHVVFFASGTPIENPPQQLVPGAVEYKRQAAEFLAGVQPVGQTDPLPALKRAFDVLANADGKSGKAIFLLTDGAFPDNQKVLDLIRSRNADKSVTIFTYQYNDRSKDAATALRQIASDSRGQFRQVNLDE